jgi:hypothetical protein
MALSRITNGGVASSALPSGSVLQVVNSIMTYSQDYVGTVDTAYTVQSASGTDWATSITINQGNKILVQLNLNVAKDDNDPNIYYDLLYDVDGSNSYTNVAVGDVAGNRSRHTGNVRSYTDNFNIEESTCCFLFTPTIPNATGVVRFKVNLTQRAAGNRSFLVNATEQNNSEGGSVPSSLTAMEIVA